MIQPFKFLMTSLLMATIVSGWLVLVAQGVFVFRDEVPLGGAFELFSLVGGLLVLFSGVLLVLEIVLQRFGWSIMSSAALGVTFVGGLVWSLWFGLMFVIRSEMMLVESPMWLAGLSAVVFLGIHFFTMYWWSLMVREAMLMEDGMRGLLPVTKAELYRKISIALVPPLVIICLWLVAVITDTYPIHWLLDWRLVLVVLLGVMVRMSQFLYRVPRSLNVYLVVGMMIVTTLMGYIGIESFVRSRVALRHFRVHAICQDGIVYFSEPEDGKIALFLDTSLPFHVEAAQFSDYERVKDVLGCNTVGESLSKFSVAEVSDIPTEVVTADVPEDWVRYKSRKYGFSFAYPDSLEIVGDPELEDIPSIHTYFMNDAVSFSRVRLERDLDVQMYLRERKKLRCDYVRSNIAWSLVDRLQLMVGDCADAVAENIAYRAIESGGALVYVESGVNETRLIMEIRPRDDRPGGFLVLELLGYNEDDEFVKKFLNGITFE